MHKLAGSTHRKRLMDSDSSPLLPRFRVFFLHQSQGPRVEVPFIYSETGYRSKPSIPVLNVIHSEATEIHLTFSVFGSLGPFLSVVTPTR